MLKKLLSFLIIAGIITVIFGTIYGTVQQNYRQSTWDPQIQMAEDAWSQTKTGPSLQSVISSGTVNINYSLAPYLVFYDPSGNPLAGNGMLDGVLPKLPAGVFDYALKFGENRFTWQPQPDIRQSVVLISMKDSVHSGFVMAGRSLREIEIRENRLTFMVFIGWFVSMIGLVLLFLLHILWPRPQ